MQEYYINPPVEVRPFTGTWVEADTGQEYTGFCSLGSAIISRPDESVADSNYVRVRSSLRITDVPHTNWNFSIGYNEIFGTGMPDTPRCYIWYKGAWHLLYEGSTSYTVGGVKGSFTTTLTSKTYHVVASNVSIDDFNMDEYVFCILCATEKSTSSLPFNIIEASTSPVVTLGGPEVPLTDYFYTTNSSTTPADFESGYSLYNFKNIYETYNGSPVNNHTYFWPKPSGLPYTYLQYYNEEYEDITPFYNENISKGVWMRQDWRPYLRKVVFDTQTPGWYAVNVTEEGNTVKISATRYDTEDLALENATTCSSHIIIGVILQGSGAQGGPGHDNDAGITGHGGGGGGGGAYVEALINCYDNRIVINLGNASTYGDAATNSHIQLYNSDGSARRAAVGVGTGSTGSKGTWGPGGTGGVGGKITYINSSTGGAWVQFPLTASSSPGTQQGDVSNARWLTEDNSANSVWESWSASLIYLGSCVPGGSGGSHDTGGSKRPNPGNSCAFTGTYYVTGVPRTNLASTTTPQGMSGYAAQRFTSSCGTLVGSADNTSSHGCGGGASYMGYGSAGVSSSLIASASFGGGGGGGLASSSSGSRIGAYGGTGYLAILI